jgi:hypothetical protein
MKLTKEKILERVTTKQILDHFLKPYHNYPELKAGQLISNPFLPKKQKSPSFNIYEDNGVWKYKDFATNDRNDCWDLVQRLKKVSFQEALETIAQEMFILPSKELPLPPLKKETKPPLLFTRSFNDYELAFWAQYGITIETLDIFKVKAVSTYQSITKDGKPYSGNSKTDDPIFAYSYRSANKLYQPKSEKYRFKFLGKKDPDFVFGFDQLPEKGELVIITSGEKDVLSLVSHGFPAVCLNSETATVPSDLVDTLKNRFDFTLVLYDNDETGCFRSMQIARDHNIINITLPPFDGQINPQKPLKDISDFFKIGHSSEDLTQLISEQIIKAQEIAKSAKSAKSAKNGQNIADFEDFADFADSSKENDPTTFIEDEREDILGTTPLIDPDIYTKLPSLLKSSCDVFASQREKDVFLTSALGVLSGCMPDVYGTYGRKCVNSNLFTFILAPAANGKGVMNCAQELGFTYHKTLRDNSLEGKKQYDSELDRFNKSRNNNQETTERPVRPKFELFYLPANTSSSKLYNHLSENSGKGVICETEADTLGIMFKKDWSSYSDLLRKSFHHERLTQSRINENEYIEIDQSRVSVVLSGTPNQIFNIISSAEDGLFSRFIYYLYQSDPTWVSQRPDTSSENLDTFFRNKSEQVFELVKFFESKETEIILNRDQWDRVDIIFENYLARIIDISGREAEGVVKRMGLIFFRICMILTAIRNFEGKNYQERIDCFQSDFEIAEKLIATYIEHSLIMFENLPRSSKHTITKKPRNIDLLFDSLPDEFSRKDAVEKASEFGLSIRTVDEYLKREKDIKFHSPKAGFYIKIRADNSENNLPN